MSRPLPVEPIKLIAIDMDGTLMRSDDTVGAKTAKAIDQAISRGLHVVIATMRPPRAVLNTYEALGLDTLQINHNGALVFDHPTRRTVDHQPMAPETARKVVELASKIAPKIAIGAEVIDAIYTNGKSEDTAAAPGHAIRAGSRLEQVLSIPVTKVLMRGPTGRLGEIQAAIQSELPGCVDFAISHMRLLQVVRAGVDKAPALEKVARHYGVPRHSVMAIGDAPNDLGMMRWAGLSVAVSNAWHDVMNEAHFVVASNDEDGVAEAITRYAR